MPDERVIRWGYLSRLRRLVARYETLKIQGAIEEAEQLLCRIRSLARRWAQP